MRIFQFFCCEKDESYSQLNENIICPYHFFKMFYLYRKYIYVIFSAFTANGGNILHKEEVLVAMDYLRKYKTETERIEVKTAKDGFPKKCYDTFSSFSNKYGGIIIFGINENKGFSIDGVYDVNDLQTQVTNLCSDSMEPKLRPKILAFELEGKNLLAVKLDEIPQNKKPCYYKPKGIKNGSYTRVGDRDDIMTDYELYSLQSYNDHIFEDTRPTKRADINDLNLKELSLYINKIRSLKPNFSKNNFDECMKLCGITDANHKQIYPTLAGIMTFGNYPQAFYPQLFVACVVVPGVELGDTGQMGERFIDNKRIEGTIEEMLNGTMNFLRRNMKTSVIIDSNGKRKDKSEYPLEALREAVANALIHRDYSTQTENAYIAVNMYEDRIEIISPGTLYGTNRLDKLGTSTSMEVRNPNIVRILEEKGSVIENRHSGIPTMKREMRKYGLPDPEFYEERDSFKVIFRNNSRKYGLPDPEFYEERDSFKVIFRNNSRQQKSSDIGQQKGSGAGQQNMQNIKQNEQQSVQQKSSDIGQQKNSADGQQKGSGGGQQNERYNLKLEQMKRVVLTCCTEPKTIKELQTLLKIKSRQYFSTNIIKALIDEGKLEYTNKNSVHARNQKYKTKNIKNE
ncbi:divergent AAA domain protein [Bacillus sp. CAG:988]|nr:divergent AAA domain protein [Bacillus sp. CAG:988]